MKLAFLILLAIFGSTVSDNEFIIESDENHFRIENNVMAKEFTFSTNQPSAIIPSSIYDKENGAELLADQQNAWFDVTVNGETVTNLDDAWTFSEAETRALSNGGIEITLHFYRTKGEAAGLKVSHVGQYFPGAALFREKLVFGGDEPLSLNYRNDQVYFVFPGYDFAGTDNKPEYFQEINIATWNAELLPEYEYETSFDERVYEEGWREGRDLASNYMYHPQIHKYEMGDYNVRGPIVIWLNEASSSGWVTAYEHGSPDQDEDQEYIEIDTRSSGDSWGYQIRKQKGAYFNGENVSDNNIFETLWAMNGFYNGDSFDDGHKLLWDYLHSWITEDSFSREPLFYYNTWGWQRSAGYKGLDEREVLTEERILEEIEYAEELGVDLFVLDDGWQNNFGDWLPDENKLPGGLAPVRDLLEQKDMVFGIWLALFAHDDYSEVAQQNPDWIILNDEGNPEIGNWDRQVFNFVGPYMDYFIDVNKRLIDDGVRYFKWDGMDRHLSASPDNYHGGHDQTEDERRARYGYELTRHITRAIADLKEYQEDVVVEVDITEPHRSVGLNILSEGRYFWMNNGSTWYEDLTHYRARSSRFPVHRYGSFMPSVLMTVSNYPHDDPLHRAQRYNVSSSITGGRGFWGDIEDMSSDERKRVARYLKQPKRVAKTVASVQPEIYGEVGGSPEIYTSIDRESAQGQIIAFSGTVLEHEHVVHDLNPDHFLGVVGHSFELNNDKLTIPFRFPMGETTREAYLLGNNGNGIGIVSSSSWLKELELENGRLHFENGAPGIHEVSWAAENGRPSIEASQSVSYDVKENGDGSYSILITTKQANSTIEISN